MGVVLEKILAELLVILLAAADYTQETK